MSLLYGLVADLLFFICLVQARAAGATLHILPLQGRCWGGQSGDPDAFQGENKLTIDVAVVKGPGATAGGGGGPMLLHVSGTHGVEAHAGSAIQCCWLDQVATGAATVPAGTTAVLVHALNPYGFKYGGRYNENNVDLNRNLLVALDGSELEDGINYAWGRDNHPAKDDYESFSSNFNFLRRWYCPWDDLMFYLKCGYLLCRYSFTSIKRAAVSGQYHNPNGIWYGGDELQPSWVALLKFLQDECPAHDPVLFIDVHTGLGPPGVDTMLMKGDATARQLCRSVFGDPDPTKKVGYIMADMEDAGNAAAGYEDTHGFSSNVITALIKAGVPGWRRAHAVTQEFGTVRGVQVIKAAARRNAAWVNGASPAEALDAAQNVRDVFYVRNAAWQQKVMARGLDALTRAMRTLSTSPQVFPNSAEEMRLQG